MALWTLKIVVARATMCNSRHHTHGTKSQKSSDMYLNAQDPVFAGACCDIDNEDEEYKCGITSIFNL
ncbi:hypothetical protein SAMN04487830_10292 [Pseudobutyrivibrio sp. OR37]|nr:hypothetical protein SAMN04487830_10292 [Pseudobutyrivibrio sp. OR37]